MKILLFLPVWKRPEITEICFMGINRLKKVGIHQVSAFAVISEEEMIPLCKKYGIEYCFYKNYPLGEKKNYGLSQAMKIDFDYLVEIGSDDLLKNDFLSLYSWNLPVMKLADFIILDSETLKCKRLSGSIPKYGTGRAIHKDVLKDLKLWPDKANRGLDNSSMMRLAVAGVTQQWFKSEEPLSIDIKSEVNIWSYESSGGHSYPLEKALRGLSEQEIESIKALQHVAA